MNDAPVNVSYSPPTPRPRGRGINYRLILFLAIVSLPFFWVLYAFVNEAVHGGVEDHGSYVKVDLKAMGNFPFDPITGTYKDLPKRFLALDGRLVELEGQMYCGDSSADKVQEFQLVYDIAKCCFQGPPRVQERVFAKTQPGKFVNRYGGEVRVTGVLHVNIQKPDGGAATTVYTLDVKKVWELKGARNYAMLTSR